MVESYIAAVTNLPHKAFVYGALLALIASEDATGFAQEIINKIVESLQISLVEERNVHAAKNLIRILAIAVDYGVLNS